MATGRVPTTANSPLTAKGDLFGYSTTQARVAVGNDGETLVADSSTSTGLRYTAGTVQSNPVLNSAMQIWQRGTSFTVSGFMYVADRWQAYRAVAGYTVTRQVTNDTTNLPNIQYALRGQRDSGNTSTSEIYLAQSFESVNSIPYAGKPVTLSFYARAGANWSPTSGNLRVRLFTGTGTDQNVLSSGFTGSASPIDNNVPLTTTWQRFTYTGTLASTTTEIGVYANAIPVGTAGANDWFEITGVQIDVGSVALPFRTYAGTIQGELAACQRYYQRFDASTAEPLSANGGSLTTTISQVEVVFPVQLRIAPSSLDSSNVEVLNYGNNTSYSGGTLAINLSTKSAMQLRYTHGSAVFTAGNVVHFRSGAGTGYIGWSAEL